MATIWELAKASYAKREARKLQETQRQHPLDAGLPFGLHIDSKLDIHPVPNSKLLMKVPGKSHLVQAFSKAVVLGKTCFKVLLHSEEGDTVSYLWIFKDDKGVSIRWFVSLDEVFPQTDQEWDFWFSDTDGSIGLPNFQTKTGELYPRVWESGNAARVDPISYNEVLYTDRYDETKKILVGHDCMLYGRGVQGEINAADELVLLSGITDLEGNFIAIDVGIELSLATDITVVY